MDVHGSCLGTNGHPRKDLYGHDIKKGIDLFKPDISYQSLNSFIVFFGTFLGSILVYFFSNWIGKPSQKFGLPFVVLLRSSLGISGAKYFGLLRSLVGIFLFGIQTYFLSKAIGYMLRIFLFITDPSILDKEIFLIFLLGMNIIDWASIIITIIFQGFLFSAGMRFNKSIIKFSALSVYFGILIFVSLLYTFIMLF